VKKGIVILGIVAGGVYLLARRARAQLMPVTPTPEGRDLYYDPTGLPRTPQEVGAMVTAFLDSVPDPPDEEERRVLYYFLLIERAGRSFRIEPALIAAVIHRESRGFPEAVGKVGEVGLMQVRPTTADMMYNFGIYRGDRAYLSDPEININYGAAYLRWQMDRYVSQANRVYWAVAAYNAGTAEYDYTKHRFSNESYVSDVVDRLLQRYAYLFNRIYMQYGRL